MNPSKSVHVWAFPLEFLRPEDRCNQVSDQDESHKSPEQVSHVLEPLAGIRIKGAEAKEYDCDKDVKKIDHDLCSFLLSLVRPLERKAERAALPLSALGVYCTAVRLYDLFDDREPQTHPCLLLLIGDAEELFKNAL